MKNLLDLKQSELDGVLEQIAKNVHSRERKWSEKELEIVKRLRARGVRLVEIAKLLDRSVYSVEHKSRYL